MVLPPIPPDGPYRRARTRNLFKVIPLEEAMHIGPIYWQKSDFFIVDCPDDQLFWENTCFFRKLVSLGGTRMLRKYPMDMMNQANIRFSARCAGFGYEAKGRCAEEKSFTYFVPHFSLSDDKALRPMPYFNIIDGNPVCDINAFWYIFYVSPLNIHIRRGFNPDLLLAERIKYSLACAETRKNPLEQLQRLLNAYNSYEKNIALKHEYDKYGCPDRSTHDEHAEDWDPWKPKKNILDLFWTNDEPKETDFDEEEEKPKEPEKVEKPPKEKKRNPRIRTPYPPKKNQQVNGYHDEDDYYYCYYDDIESDFSIKTNETYMTDQDSNSSRRPSKKRKKPKKMVADKWTMTEMLQEKIRQKDELRAKPLSIDMRTESARRENQYEAQATVGEKLKPDPWHNIDKTSQNCYKYSYSPPWRPSYKDALLGKQRGKLRHY